MNSHIDPLYLSQIEAAREAVYAAGSVLLAEQRAFRSRQPHRLSNSLKLYSEQVEEHNVIIDAVCGEHWGDFYEKPLKWQHGSEGQLFEEWVNGIDRSKIEPLDMADVRLERKLIVCGPDDADEFAASLSEVILQ